MLVDYFNDRKDKQILKLFKPQKLESDVYIEYFNSNEWIRGKILEKNKNLFKIQLTIDNAIVENVEEKNLRLFYNVKNLLNKYFNPYEIDKEEDNLVIYDVINELKQLTLTFTTENELNIVDENIDDSLQDVLENSDIRAKLLILKNRLQNINQNISVTAYENKNFTIESVKLFLKSYKENVGKLKKFNDDELRGFDLLENVYDTEEKLIEYDLKIKLKDDFRLIDLFDNCECNSDIPFVKFRNLMKIKKEFIPNFSMFSKKIENKGKFSKNIFLAKNS